MAFFKNKEVDKKYNNTAGDADPVINVAIQYQGKLSEMPLNIADKVYADGAHIALKGDKVVENAGVKQADIPKEKPTEAKAGK